jgi:hypothetical protein
MTRAVRERDLLENPEKTIGRKPTEIVMPGAQDPSVAISTEEGGKSIPQENRAQSDDPVLTLQLRKALCEGEELLDVGRAQSALLEFAKDVLGPKHAIEVNHFEGNLLEPIRRDTNDVVPDLCETVSLPYPVELLFELFVGMAVAIVDSTDEGTFCNIH